jgi:2-keto-4-pentenoate hydratase
MMRALPPREEPYRREEVAAAVGSVMPALEVCAGRWSTEDGSEIPTPLFVADASGNGAVVCGAPFTVEGKGDKEGGMLLLLDKVRISLSVNGEEKAAGTGANVGGEWGPYKPWYSRKMQWPIITESLMCMSSCHVLVGHPLDMLTWLANNIPQGLREHDLIITGNGCQR